MKSLIMLITVLLLTSPLAYSETVQHSGELWDDVSKEMKIKIIESIIKQFKDEKGVIIKKPAEYYVDEIDALRAEDPKAKDYPVGLIFRTIAIMAYDFDEGIDKEQTLKNWLGEERYEMYKDGLRKYKLNSEEFDRKGEK